MTSLFIVLHISELHTTYIQTHANKAHQNKLPVTVHRKSKARRLRKDSPCTLKYIFNMKIKKEKFLTRGINQCIQI